jgi:hypothetical protein
MARDRRDAAQRAGDGGGNSSLSGFAACTSRKVFFVSRRQKQVDLLRRYRAADQIPLDVGAAVGGDAGHLLFGFNTFSYRRHPETLTERGDRVADRVVRCAANEGLIDLDPVKWKTAQVAQRRIADSEIIESDAHASPAKSLQHGERRPPRIEHYAFGDLKLQTPRIEAASQRRHNRRDKIWVLELDRRNIDGNLARTGPGCCLEAGGPKHPFSDRGNDAGIFRDRNKFER